MSEREDINRQTRGTLPLYLGTAFGSFDGVLLLLDSLAHSQRAVLVLTAGGKEIDCTITGVDDEEIRKAYKRRCVVKGLAHYGGGSGLPERLDIREIEVVESAPGLDTCRGAFNLPAPDDEIWG